ncbi:MAG: hypothetical protein GIW95_09390 [Candidatus Eremiobacteraeota bacterium]|nr:hypothetical protein [Candidatus Eremiobacteraeota bacterium]
MIARAMADALTRIERRANDLRHLYEPGFVPADPASRAGQQPAPALDPLSVVAPAGSYFVVSSERGQAYVRDGAFAFADGTLRTRSGAAVLGSGDSAVIGPLRADPVDVALERVSAARIDADGTLSYERDAVDPRSGENRVERVVVGRIALARFPAGSAPDAAAAPAATGLPGEGAFSLLQTFARDRGALDPAASVIRLQEAYLSLEALRSAGSAGDSFERVALEIVK